jgi:hypothetical protein
MGYPDLARPIRGHGLHAPLGIAQEMELDEGAEVVSRDSRDGFPRFHHRRHQGDYTEGSKVGSLFPPKVQGTWCSLIGKGTGYLVC